MSNETLDILDELTRGPDTNVEPTDTDTDSDADTSSKYPSIVATYNSDADTTALGLLTVAEFAGELTVRNLTEKGMKHEGIVKDPTVYQAMKAKRHPLPVVLVGDTAFLPAKEAFEAWENRPVRGEGTGVSAVGGRRSDEDLLRLAAEARENAAKREALFQRSQVLRDKAREKAVKYARLIRDRFGDNAWDRVDEWVSANEAKSAIADADDDNDNE